MTRLIKLLNDSSLFLFVLCGPCTLLFKDPVVTIYEILPEYNLDGESGNCLGDASSLPLLRDLTSQQGGWLPKCCEHGTDKTQVMGLIGM